MNCAEKLVEPTIFFNLHQVTLQFRFRKSLAQERFSRYQIIVSSIKDRFCEVYDTDSLVYEVFELTNYCDCWSQQHSWML